MTQLVRFPDRVWARLATIAERREISIADLIVDATEGILGLPRPEPVCELEHVKPKREGPGRPSKVDWQNPVVEARIREAHALHRKVGDLATEFGVGWDAMRTAYKHLGITPHRNNTTNRGAAA